MWNLLTRKEELPFILQPAGLMSTQVGCVIEIEFDPGGVVVKKDLLSPTQICIIFLVCVLVKVLASYGSVNQRDCNGNTPLHLGQPVRFCVSLHHFHAHTQHTHTHTCTYNNVHARVLHIHMFLSFVYTSCRRGDSSPASRLVLSTFPGI